MSVSNLFVPNYYHIYADEFTVNTLDVTNLTVENLEATNVSTNYLEVTGPSVMENISATEITASGNVTATTVGANNVATDQITFNGTNQTSLSSYEQGTFSLSMSGPWAAPIVKNAYFQKIGNKVSITLDSYSAAATVATFISSTAGAIPARLRPVNVVEVGFEVMVTDDGVRQNNPGWLQVLTNGNIAIYKTNDLGTFTIGAGGSGINPISISYVI